MYNMKMSPRVRFIAVSSTFAAIAAVACATPGVAVARCIPRVDPCELPPPPPPKQTLSITGTQDGKTLSNSPGGTPKVYSFEFSYPVSEPPVTFTASGSLVRVVATDSLSCWDQAGVYWGEVTASHDSRYGHSVQVSWQPNLTCPVGQKVWESDQTAHTELAGGATTASIAFAWGYYN